MTADERVALADALAAVARESALLAERLAVVEAEAMKLREEGRRRPPALDVQLRALRRDLAAVAERRRGLNRRLRDLEEGGGP
jgi:hypothetical protein